MPLITILLPVYQENKAFLSEAVNSLLAQTLRDFELLILDDGSEPSYAEYLDTLQNKDARLTVLHLPHRGITKTLNTGLAHARGKWLARMDADDVALPHRFEKQSEFLRQNPDHALVGSWVRFINTQGAGSWIKKYPANYAAIKKRLIAHNRFTHAALMWDTHKLRVLGGYDERLTTAQDYDLILRAAQHFPVANLPEVLLNYRYRQTSISWKKQGKQQELAALRIRIRALVRYGYPAWQAVFLLRPVFTYLIPKKIKFSAWETFVWNKTADIPYGQRSFWQKTRLLFVSNLAARQKIKGLGVLFLRQRACAGNYRAHFSAEAASQFIRALSLPYEPFGQWRFSVSNPAPSRFASCFAYLALNECNTLKHYNAKERKAWALYLANCQDKQDGLWHEIEMNSKTHDKEYIALQLTSLALGILEAEGVTPLYPLRYLEQISWPTWLLQRDFSDPWKEGNRLLFMGTLLRQTGNQEPLNLLMNFLDKTVDPHTGFWGTNAQSLNFQPPYKKNPAGKYQAMLGAYHQYRLYALLGRTPPHTAVAAQTTLALQYPDGLFRRFGGGGACEDMDAIEILVQAYPHADTALQATIRSTLTAAQKHLQALQQTNGGFSYNPYVTLVYSGIPLLACQRAESDIFSTYFRLKTLYRIEEFTKLTSITTSVI